MSDKYDHMPLKLTPLQEAALARIHDFEAEFARRGIKVRLSFEQKFSIWAPSTREINLGSSDRYLKNNFPTFQFLKPQNYNKHKIEALFSTGRAEEYAPDGRAKLPSELAWDIAKFRKYGHGCIEKNSGVILQHELLFEPISATKITEGTELDGGHPMTKGLHASTSVYDANGNDLSNNTAFRRIMSERLLNLHYHGGLGFIQSDDNLKRLDSWLLMPKKLGLGVEKEEGMSVVERTPDPRTPDGDHKYNEDRFAGADADPFVITALQLAVIYDAITQHPSLKDEASLTKELLDAKWPKQDIRIKHAWDHPIDKTMDKWVERFTSARDKGLAGHMNWHSNYGLKDLLGEPLYEGILAQYGKAESVAR